MTATRTVPAAARRGVPGFASGLYVGSVHHRRRRPVTNVFRYRTYHALLDVDELPALDAAVRWFGHNRRALVGFRDRDHLGPADLPVREKLARWLAGAGVILPAGPVRVLTNLRVLGHVFDPVSWWFCHHPDGQLAFVVAEVNNTFGEGYCYLLDELEPLPSGAVRAEAGKAFHVSPFLPIDGLRYTFTLVPPGAHPTPGDRVLAHIDVEDADGALFDATQSGRRRDFSSAQLRRLLLSHPLMPLRTVALINLQALRLWRRRVPFFRKPEPPDGGYARVLRPPAPAIPQAADDERVADAEERRS